MDGQQQRALVRDILHPDPSHSDEILQQLGLLGLPSNAELHHELEDKFLRLKRRLPAHWLPQYQVHWEEKIDIPSLLPLEPSPHPTSISFVRAGLDGRVTGYAETPNPEIATGLTSTSMDRAAAPATNFVRGKTGFMPFWPGGLEQNIEKLQNAADGGHPTGLRTIPPGFPRGLNLTESALDDEHAEGILSLERDEELQDIVSHEALGSAEPKVAPSISGGEIDALLPESREHLRPSIPKQRKRLALQKRDWAHVINVNEPLVNFHELVPTMARQYPFELDTFQKQAVYHLEMGNSVFVAAHTSAGKTVVAEYAIALAEKHMTRAIYTSPIKALSNQKFRDFKQTFSSASVGILTGDVQINPEASCLIMTTEILRSMLYKGADLIRDVEFVIFDEVHYVNDNERGVVWEEVIIMLPDHVSIILLSATVPNTKEFADWVGRTKKKDIYVISTAQRPVPLEHYIYAGRDIYKIVDAKRQFLGQGYKDAGEALRRKQDREREAAGLPPAQRVGSRGGAQRGSNRGRGSPVPVRGGGSSARTIHTGVDKNLYVHLLNYLKKATLLPVVVFTFSKKRCEENAATLSNADVSNSTEKSEVHVAVEKALARLKPADRKLPQINRMRDLLSRGIGVHHGGLLPIVKELVEILFARGLVKILFATETFAMGVNMPAKSVVFSGIRKHDGHSFRTILPGEYTQMAGRAGRRGLDSTGTVIIIASDSLPEETTLRTMMLGTPGKLSSQFRLTYNMILNLLRVEALKVEEMIKRSFSENASQRMLPDQQKKVMEGEKALSSLPKLLCDTCSADINLYYDTSLEVQNLNQKLLSMSVSHPQGAKLLAPGRIAILRDGHFQNGDLAVVLKPAPFDVMMGGVLDKTKRYYVLARVAEATKNGRGKDAHTDGDDNEAIIDLDDEAIPPKWPPHVGILCDGRDTYEVKAVPLSSIWFVTSKTIKIDVDAIIGKGLRSRAQEALSLVEDALKEWTSSNAIPEAEWSRIRSLEFQETLRTRDTISKRNEERQCLACQDFDNHCRMIHAEKLLKANIASLKLSISDQNLELIPDYEQRIDVLKELKFIDENSTVLLKGRVACEINSANELILTELLLENTLAAYEPEEVVALLSCFVFQEKTDVEPVIPPKLEEGRDAINTIADRIGRLQDRYSIAAEDARTKLKFGLIEVVYEWAKGMPFEQITALTDVPEGTIVRVITRLDETCREVRDAARVIGDAGLFKKMEDSQQKIKRDIVFAASLYF